MIMFLGCQKQQQDWPQSVTDNMWVDGKAKRIEKRILNGTYQIEYMTVECYPDKGFLKEMVQSMSKKGWKRLDYDFLNPAIQTNHVRMPGGLWSHVEMKGKDTFQWIDDWEDSEKNIVRYFLRYQGENAAALEKTCDLEVVVIYTPKKIREDIRNRISAGQDKRR